MHSRWKYIKIKCFAIVLYKIKVNLPLAIIKLCIESGLALPNINGKDVLKNIDFHQIFILIESGVIGKLVEIETADGDIITITVE